MAKTNPSPIPDFMRGMTYASFQPDVFKSAASDEAIDELAKINANWVAVNLWWYQKGPTTYSIFRNPEKTATDESLIHLIQYIRAHGMQIMLKPMLDSLDDTWRGNFKPRSWDKWFQNYTKFMLHYAQIAEDFHIPLLCIGCEFPFNKRDRQKGWFDLIKAIRKVYSGKLTYAANFNKHNSFKKVKFWDKLDYIGIDAYFAVSKRKLNSKKRMQRGWRKRLRRINRWYRWTRQNKPVIFTEAGVCSVSGAASTPWAYDLKTEPNWEEQANYYEAFFNSLKKANWLHGVFWWWWDNPSTGDYIHSNSDAYASSYTPKGKEAEKVLARFYS